MTVLNHLLNAPDLDRSERYAAILGEHPSLGARSPSLWNAVFEAEGLDVFFHPFDVAADQLAPLVAALKADPRFVGGAVAVPYKTALVPLVDRVEPAASRIGAVNCLYRDGEALCAANSDGLAARDVLREALGAATLGGRRILVIGIGGAGAAIAATLADDLDGEGRVVLANRDRAKAEVLAARIGARAEAIDWPLRAAGLAGVDVLVNATSLGFAPVGDAARAANRRLTAVGAAEAAAENISESILLLDALPPHALVFDAVYQPRETMLLHLAAGRGLAILGGAGMNLEQAVIGFGKAVQGIDPTRVRAIMFQVP